VLRLADVVRRHATGYLARFGDAILPSHVRALRAIALCRTPALGGHSARCTQCGHEHLLYHSCRHRACPQCGHDATERWLMHQRDLLLSVPYFHVVFTLPSELRRVVRSHQRILLAVLCQAAFETLASLCADPQWLGGRVGALAVLHTWTRTIEWHPHVHLLVPGGALGPDGRTWLKPPAYRKLYLVPQRALAKRFRGRFLALARRALPNVTFPSIPWGKRWVVSARPPVHDPNLVLEYLGRYVHRTALSDKAIVGCSDQCVTFNYRDSRDHQRKTMTLAAHEFLRRFLQHVPPKGMHRVRAFGLLHPSQRHTLRRLQLLLAPRQMPSRRSPRPRPKPRCRYCHGETLQLLRRLTPEQCLAFELRRVGELSDAARAPPVTIQFSRGTG